MQFTASGFGSGAPTDPVTGTIVWDAASTTSAITSLSSIDLTIDGHAFSLGETGFTTSGAVRAIGGTVNGVGVLSSTLPFDFVIVWFGGSLLPSSFAYTSPDDPPANLIPGTQHFDFFSITTEVAAPEPASLLLIGLGLAGLGFSRRKKA
jgi:hypothetical protein